MNAQLRIAVVIALLAVPALRTAHAEGEAPWKTNPPIAEVRRSLYLRHPRPGWAAFAQMWYAGPGGRRLEIRGLEHRDDVPAEIVNRQSGGNQGPWGSFELSPQTITVMEGTEVWQGGGAKVFDPISGRLVEVWLRQIQTDGRYNCFTYCRTSKDGGRTWDEPRQLKYEPGADFDPKRPLAPEFLEKNQGYFGSNILLMRDGSLLHCLAHANAPGDPENAKRPWRMGSVLMRGVWNPKSIAYDWQPLARTEISPEKSSRGLMEPEIAELNDGRLLIVWRGSDTPQTPGRKWMALSPDAGRTLGPVETFKYDDGSEFYSPSSFHRMIRHSVTKKLYWIGNICPDPPKANSPRYPLVIAEVDEEKVALRKGTVTAIADRDTGQPEAIQFSNFSLLEDIETHELELYMTHYGEQPDDWRNADCWQYFVKLK